jgi:hypothetical protein
MPTVFEMLVHLAVAVLNPLSQLVHVECFTEADQFQPPLEVWVTPELVLATAQPVPLENAVSLPKPPV